jgi:hypothetical protein
MTSFEIPYAQLSDGTWPVTVSHLEHRYFFSRMAALGYAIIEARKRARRGIATIISVEGADGQWRAFDDDMKSFAAKRGSVRAS